MRQFRRLGAGHLQIVFMVDFPSRNGNLPLIFNLAGKQTANIHHVGNIHAKHFRGQPFQVESGQLGGRQNFNIGCPARTLAHQSMLDLVVKDQGLALYGDEYFFQNDFFKSGIIFRRM